MGRLYTNCVPGGYGAAVHKSCTIPREGVEHLLISVSLLEGTGEGHGARDVSALELLIFPTRLMIFWSCHYRSSMSEPLVNPPDFGVWLRKFYFRWTVNWGVSSGEWIFHWWVSVLCLTLSHPSILSSFCSQCGLRSTSCCMLLDRPGAKHALYVLKCWKAKVNISDLWRLSFSRPQYFKYTLTGIHGIGCICLPLKRQSYKVPRGLSTPKVWRLLICPLIENTCWPGLDLTWFTLFR